MAPTLFISITTFTSPTALAVKDPPNLLVMSASARVEDKFETDGSGAIIQSPTEISFELTLTERPETLDIGGWNNDNFYIQERYFLPGQELRLKEPWSGNQDEVGIFIIDEEHGNEPLPQPKLSGGSLPNSLK